MEKEKKIVIVIASVLILAVALFLILNFSPKKPFGEFDFLLTKSAFPSTPEFGELGSFNALPDQNSLFKWPTNPFRKISGEV